MIQQNNDVFLKIPLNLNYIEKKEQKISLTLYIKEGVWFLTFYIKINNSKFSQLNNNYLWNEKIRKSFEKSQFLNPIFLNIKTNVKNKEKILENKDILRDCLNNNRDLNILLNNLNLIGKNFANILLKYQANLDLYLPMIMPHQIEKEKPHVENIIYFLQEALKKILNEKLLIVIEEVNKEQELINKQNNLNYLNELVNSGIKI